MSEQSVYFKAFITALMVFAFCDPLKTEIVKLTSRNINETLATHKFAIVTFYEDWCFSCLMVLTSFKEQKDVIDEIISENGNVVMGTVNCDNEESICDRYKISIVPHIKVLTNASLTLFEYVGGAAGENFLKNITQIVNTLN